VPDRLRHAARPDRCAASGRRRQEEALLLFVALSSATGALALLVSRASILEWARAALPERLQTGVRCSFCVAFWFACVTVALYGPLDVADHSLLLSVLAVWGGAAVVAALATLWPDAA
jgi:hypothetical protein